MRIRSSGPPRGGVDEGAAGSRPRRRRLVPLLAKLLVALALLAVAGVIWLFVAPRSLGGVFAVSAVGGASMEPRVRTGDLVVLQVLDTYRPGDVVAYRNRAAAHTFLHRIVGMRDGRFVMRGDRNAWLDPGTAAPGDIIGALRLRIPEAGAVVAWLQVPRHGGAVASLTTAAVLLLGGGASVRRRRRRHGPGWPAPLAAPTVESAAGPPPGSALPVVAAGFVGLVLIVAGTGTAVAFTRPTSEDPPAARYVETGELTYAAAVPRSAVYPDGRVSTGDPIYLRLVRRLDLAFGYRFASAAPHQVAATGSLTATVSDGDGWQRVIPLETTVQRAPDTVVLRAPLLLSDLRRLLARVRSITGIATGSYSVSLEARVDVAGTVSGGPVRDAFTSHTGMRLDQFQLQTGAAPGGAEPLARTVVSHRVARAGPPRPTVLGPAWARISVADLRRLSPGADVVLGALLALMLHMSLRGGRRDHTGLIHVRYGRFIVPLAVPPALDGAAVDVQDMRSLVRLARRYEAAILHHGNGRVNTYLVLDGGTAYRYRTGDVEAPADRSLPAIDLLPAAAASQDPPPARPTAERRPARRLLGAASPFERGDSRA